MPRLVGNGATLTCTFGGAPCTLVVLPRATRSEKGDLAVVSDHQPTNIAGFAVCMSPTHPVVASTGAPVPCQPVIPAPWVPGLVYGTYEQDTLLTASSVCTCVHAGVIQVADPNCFVTAD